MQVGGGDPGRGESVTGLQPALDDGCAQLFVQLHLLRPGIVGIEEELHVTDHTPTHLDQSKPARIWLCLAVHVRLGLVSDGTSLTRPAEYVHIGGISMSTRLHAGRPGPSFRHTGRRRALSGTGGGRAGSAWNCSARNRPRSWPRSPAADRATAHDVKQADRGAGVGLHDTVHGSAQRVARTAEEVHAVLRDAFNCGDIHALVAIYENDATLLVPAGGRSAHGHDEIRAMMAPVLAARPRMSGTVDKTLVGDGWALTHTRWEITGDGGNDTTLTGRGTVVSRRRLDGTWRIVLDDPLSPA